MPRVAIYPGSFDPLTNGHVDIITRGAALFDRIIVGVLVNAGKTPLFDVEARLAIIRETFAALPNVEIKVFNPLFKALLQVMMALKMPKLSTAKKLNNV